MIDPLRFETKKSSIKILFFSVFMRVIGFDPGIEKLGYGIIERDARGEYHICTYGIIRTHKSQSLAERLHEISTDLQAILQTYNPTHAVVEQLVWNRNVTSALAVAHARGIILSTTYKHNIQILEISQSHLKLAVTGNGNETKKIVQSSLEKLIKQELTGQDDAIDALGLAWYGATYPHLFS